MSLHPEPRPTSARVPEALPDFFVLGVAKAGTTSLHHYLRQHPSLYLPYLKELHFFDAEDGRFPSALDRYLEHFSDAGPRLAGEATASYFRHVDVVADRMLRLYDEASPRFLVLLRDPAERAYSHYLHNVSEGRETASFPAALEAERARPARAREAWKGYFSDGVYADTLAQWFGAFSRERFLILLSDDLRNDRDATVRRVFRFLGVDPDADVDTGRCLNRTGERQSRALGSVLSRLPGWLPALARRWTPETVRLGVEQFIRRRSTGSGADRPSLDAKLERRLRKRYAPHVRRLEEMIDRDLSDWLPAAARSSPDRPDEPARRGSSRQAASVSGRQAVAWLLVSLLALAVVGWLTFDAAAFRKLLRNLRPTLLLGAAAMTLARIGFGGWRLSYVSRGRLGLRSGIRGQLAWYFFANVTPTVIGGAPPATLYVAYDEDLSVGRSAAIMLFCMLLNQVWFVVAIPLLVGASFAVDVLPDAGGALGRWSLLACFGGLFLWGLAFAYFTLVRPRRLVEIGDWLLRWPVLRRFRERGMRELRSYFRSAKRLGTRSPSFFVRSFLLTAPVWLARYAVVLLVVASVYSVERVLLFLRSAAMLLVGLIMPTPGGAGGLEGLYVLFVGPLVPETLVAPTLLSWRLLDYYLFLALGAYLVLYHVRPGERLGPSTAGP